jgi:VWFA-related protein
MEDASTGGEPGRRGAVQFFMDRESGKIVVSAYRIGLICLTVAALTAPALAEEPEIYFVKPKNRTTVVGETTVQVLLGVPDGGTLDRVELFVDGMLFKTLRQAPWTAKWDAGGGEKAHRLEAVLILTDGREARAVVRTRALTIDMVEQVGLVDLYLIVRDGRGGYVTNLERDDFRIYENGRPQTIERFSTTHKPLRIAIVLDTSLTMSREQKLEKAKSAALQFLDVLEDGDEAMVVTFSDRVRTARRFTADRDALANTIRESEAYGGTALYYAIWKTARLLKGFQGRKVLVLLSDGRDEAANGLEPGSLHTLEEAVEESLRNDVMVFTIGLGRNLDREYAMRWGALAGGPNVDVDLSLEDILRRVAGETGGRALIASSAGKLRKAFSQFATDLRHQYSIAYVSTDTRRNGKWRKLKVEIPERDLEVVSRKGYYAPEGD